MRLVALGLLLAVLAARPAEAGKILYATAASENRIDGFCIRGGGALDPAPSPGIPTSTGGAQPRRLLVSGVCETSGLACTQGSPCPAGDTCVAKILYVAELDRVEAFAIGPHGDLTRAGRTAIDPHMNPRDILLSPDGTMLYVPQNRFSRVVAYQVHPERGSSGGGAIDDNFTTCIQGPEGSGYQSLLIDGSRLYTVASGPDSGRVDVFALDAAGNFLNVATGMPLLRSDTCVKPDKGKPPASTRPLSSRNRLFKPRSFFIANDVLYVEERGRRRITAFALHHDDAAPCFIKRKKIKQPIDKDGNPVTDATGNQPADGDFCPPTPRKPKKKTPAECVPTLNPPPHPFPLPGCKPQPFVDHTRAGVGYQDLVLDTAKSLIFAAQFVRGRVDSYRLTGDTQHPLPHAPLGKSREDLRMSPVRLALDGDVLYVAAGALDQVAAYSVGHLDGQGPFSLTDEQKGSFPNDVAVAVLSAACD